MRRKWAFVNDGIQEASIEAKGLKLTITDGQLYISDAHGNRFVGFIDQHNALRYTDQRKDSRSTFKYVCGPTDEVWTLKGDPEYKPLNQIICLVA